MNRLSFHCQHQYSSKFQLDVAFESADGVTALFGPSGAGKTTILKIIAGFLTPDGGRVQLGNRTLLDTRQRVSQRPERRRVAVVFQDHLLFPHMNVRANLNYGRRRQESAKVDFARLVEILQIDPLLDRYPSNLSGGEQQRVALGRALLSDPELLLMDEPLASLDTDLKARILDYLEKVLEEWEIPTLFVTHSQGEVRRLANQVVVLQQGRIISQGSPDEALCTPELLGWKNAVGPVNLLRLDDICHTADSTTGRVGVQVLQLPDEETRGRASLFVQFLPADVTLSRHEVDGLSTRNQLNGVVRQVVPFQRAVFVEIDIGQSIWAEITRKAATELALTPGDSVTCLLKTQSLQVIS